MERHSQTIQSLSRGLRWLRALAHSLVGSSDAEDIAQQVALRTVARGPMAVRHPRAYLARVARNLVIDEARKLRVRGGAALALDDVDESALPFTAPDQETALLLKQIILGLPPLYRDVFILNRFTGLTYEEIALRCGITVKAVEYRMSRALALCQEALRD